MDPAADGWFLRIWKVDGSFMLQLPELMMECIQKYYAEGTYLSMSLLAFVYLFASSRDWKKKLVYPSIILFAVLCVPIFFTKFLRRYRYVRWFWIIPGFYAVTMVLSLLLQKIKLRGERLLLVAVLAFILIGFRPSMFTTDTLWPTKTLYKVDEQTAMVADILLEQDEHPRCLAAYPLYSQIRQVSGEITLLYGRDVQNFIIPASKELKEVYKSFESDNPDYTLIMDAAVKGGCNFVITRKAKPLPEDVQQKYGFAMVGQVPAWTIYYKA